MKSFLGHLLAFHMAASLCLAQQKLVMPPAMDGFERMSVPRPKIVQQHGFVPQQEVVHQQDFVPQQESVPELPLHILQEEAELPPVRMLGEPVFSPRGRKPILNCADQATCPKPHQAPPGRLNLPDFPPGQPSKANIGNICMKERERPNYGPHNLPQTGFAHLSRQGNAITSIEAGFSQCCSQQGRLNCAQEVWRNGLDQFCEEEFSVKTRHHHCCKRSGSERQSCFAKEAPNAGYEALVVKPVQVQEVGSAQVPVLGSARARNLCSSDQAPNSECRKTGSDTSLRRKLPKVSFPPGEPSDKCIQNICRLRKFRPLYSPQEIPQTGHGWLQRQAKAINRIENEYKKCCKSENATCAHDAWEEVLSDFCEQELTVRTRHYDCCLEDERADRFSCFASKAPFPNYDKELDNVDLGNVNASTVGLLCGNAKLLTKQKQIPLLVKSLTDKCCERPSEESVQCAEEEKASFVEMLCSTKKDSWKDSEKCCNKEGSKRMSCFNDNYLQNITVAGAGTDV
ncbi:extracellular matrix protein 1 [Ambystoma mexicanum]|uniref:extracellular matrix protein 1 n=1 Tax=Ambystoma mexicanum TaxID=8296 RepID=UPI0037E71695